MQGAKIVSDIEVDKVVESVGSDGLRKVCGVRTTCGKLMSFQSLSLLISINLFGVPGQVIKCEKVVNCAGMWARQLGEKNGVCIPNQAAEHYYLITESMQEVDPSWPVIEDPSSHTYIRPEGGGLMIGLFEPDAAAWNCQVH